MNTPPPPNYQSVSQGAGHRSAAPIPTAEELSAFYANVYFQSVPTSTFSHSYPEEELEHKRARAALMVRVAATALGGAAGRRLLDVGFGEGFELAAARDAGFACNGVDFGLHALRNFNPSLESCVEAANPLTALEHYAAVGRRFDVCMLKNVLEHVPDPAACLAAVRRVLSRDGVAVITLPNDYSELQLELRRRGLVDSDYWFAPPQHLHYFTPDGFRDFSAAQGFTTVDLVGDFPIELFLLHPGSNYARRPEVGKDAHRARVAVELLLARRGPDAFVEASRALARTGLSRTFTACCRVAP